MSDNAANTPNEFRYTAAHDLDGDGNIDQVHAMGPDGARIYTLDDAGNVIAEQVDSNGDGTYDTTMRLNDDGSLRTEVDLNNDGFYDVVLHSDPETGQTYQQDVVVDGEVIETHLDLDGDGKTDLAVTDTTGDGTFDTVALDSDGDGFINEKLVDSNGDGVFDQLHVDSDNTDGILETIVLDGTAEGFGTVEMVEDIIPHPDTLGT